MRGVLSTSCLLAGLFVLPSSCGDFEADEKSDGGGAQPGDGGETSTGGHASGSGGTGGRSEVSGAGSSGNPNPACDFGTRSCVGTNGCRGTSWCGHPETWGPCFCDECLQAEGMPCGGLDGCRGIFECSLSNTNEPTCVCELPAMGGGSGAPGIAGAPGK